MSALADVRDWAASTRLASGERVIDAEWVRLSLARVHAKAEFLKLLNWRVAGGRRPAPARPTRRPRRCSAPSSRSRRTGC